VRKAGVRRAVLGLVLLAGPLAEGGVAEGAEHAREPGAPSFWAGLDPAVERAPARGVHAVRPPLGGRVRIEGGTFVMGSAAADIARAREQCERELRGLTCRKLVFFALEAPAHMVSLSTFLIDQTEVRVEDFDRCVSAGACSPAGFSRGDPRFDRPSLPVTHVTWEDAGAYCAWAGGRLPTEAEWELAARGSSSREYPWGEAYNPHLANHGTFFPFSEGEPDDVDGFLGLAPVGSFPDGATPGGLVDMAGNVAEWVFDYFDRDDHGSLVGYPSASQYNPRGPASGERHVVRGGSYLTGAAWMRTASRWLVEFLSAPDVGFRCAADVVRPPL